MDYLQYIKPELLVLVPMLFFIGKVLISFKIDTTRIPVVLGILGLAMSSLWILGTAGEYANIHIAIFTAIVQGVLCAGAAVYSDQIVKQTNKHKMAKLAKQK